MTLWTCKACGLVIVPDDATAEALKKAMTEHIQTCAKEKTR
ncbi:hypothetical protein O7600_20095 [Micromonospora sp. WMMA1998]|nr:hypothetical protein [Micromonospora sp. WMMA1998]WBC13433.1 hypothetical protein O7600_20095 [Micromonospora sp. WMMA1998]